MPIFEEDTIQPSTIVDSTGVNIASVSAAGAVKVDGSAVTQPVSVASLPLPTGAATAALQTTGNASLVSIDAGIPAGLGQTTMAASMPVTIASNQSAIPVTGTFWQATQPVSGTVTVTQATGTNLHTVVDSSALPTGASTSALQTTANTTLAAIDAGIPVALGQTTMSASMPVVIASDQSPVPVTFNTATGVNVLKTAQIVTTTVTADQVVLTYTVTAGKTLYVQYIAFGCYLTNQPGNPNPVDLGDIHVQTPSGTNIIQSERFHPKIADFVLTFPQAIPIAAGVVFRITCTPSSTTSTTWEGNFGGFER